MAIITSILIGLILISLELAFKHVVPYAIVQPQRISDNLHPDKWQLPYQNLAIQTNDSLTLKGYWIHSSQADPKAIIILLHGIGGCKEHFLGVANQLSLRGYESVLLDLRAHGDSEGQFTTYGYKEKYDVKSIVDHILAQNDSIKIGIWGNSLGGAIALQSMEVDSRISFGVIESTFRDLEEIMLDYQVRIAKIPMGYFMKKAMKESEKIADYEIEEVKPIESVSNIQNPVLISHGNADEHISYIYGQELFEGLNGKENEWILIDGANHYNLSKVGGQGYQDKLYGFIERQTWLMND